MAIEDSVDHVTKIVDFVRNQLQRGVTPQAIELALVQYGMQMDVAKELLGKFNNPAVELPYKQLTELLIGYVETQLQNGVSTETIELALGQHGMQAEAAKSLINTYDEHVKAAFTHNVALGNWEQADKYVNRLLGKNPYNIDALKARTMFWYHFRGNSEEVEKFVAQANIQPKNMLESYTYLENCCNALGRIIFSDLDDRKIMWAKQLIRDARAFDISVLAETGEHVIRYNKILKDFFDTFDFDFILTALSKPDPWPIIAFATSNGTSTTLSEVCATAERLNSELVFLVSADELYINRYAHSYVTSTLNTYNNCLIVICVVGGIERLNIVAANIGITDDRLIFFGDYFDPTVAGSHHPRVYYQTARFRWVGYLLEHLPLPIMTTDIDMVVNRDIQNLLDRFAEYDVVINEEVGSVQIQSRIIANLLLFNQTDEAKYFARALRSYIDTALCDNRILGLILDQIAMVVVRQHTQRFSKIRLGRFGPFDINNIMFTKSNIGLREFFNQFCFLALYASQDDVVNDKKWWL